MTLDDVIADIQSNWARVVAPRADRDLDDYQWDRALAAEFPGHSAWNIGDGFNYSKCYTYVIPVDTEDLSYEEWFAHEPEVITRLGGQEYLIVLKLSVVAPYYLETMIQRTIDDQGRIKERETEPMGAEQLELTQRSLQFAERNGFTQLPKEFINELVPHAALELAEPGTVTVYNCLFEDEHNLPTPYTR